MKEQVLGVRSIVTLQGSRAVKQKDTLSEVNAHTTVFAHRLAQVALKKTGIRVLQYRLVTGRRPKIAAESASRFDAENNFFLASIRLTPVEPSRTFFQHYHEFWSGGKGCGHCQACREHENLAAQVAAEAKEALIKAGFNPQHLDLAGGHNIMFTGDGPVLLEILDDGTPRMNAKAAKKFHKHFDSATAAELRKIVSEYEAKMKEIESIRLERLRQQGIE